MQKPQPEKHADPAADDRRTAAKKSPKEEKGKGGGKLARDVKRAAKPGKKADDSPGDVEIAADD